MKVEEASVSIRLQVVSFRQKCGRTEIFCDVMMYVHYTASSSEIYFFVDETVHVSVYVSVCV